VAYLLVRHGWFNVNVKKIFFEADDDGNKLDC
jgi:hypothetical protein